MDLATEAWVLILLLVIGYDMYAVLADQPTLSRRFREWFLRYRWFRLLAIGIWLWLAAHLLLGLI